MMNQAQMIGQVAPPPQPIMSQNLAVLVQPKMMNQDQLIMMNQKASNPWPQQQQQKSSSSLSIIMDPNKRFINNYRPSSNPRSTNNNSNWRGKKVHKPINNSNNSGRRGRGGYKPPSLKELQTQNRMKARKHYHPKKKFNNRSAPYAPRNSTSFIIRAKKSGGIASLVSPCPLTPVVLPTPIFSPSREVLGDIAKEEWGVDGYGSMKGLIKLRSPGNEAADVHDEDEEVNGSRESNVEEHAEVERRLEHDLSRFEMTYPKRLWGL